MCLSRPAAAAPVQPVIPQEKDEPAPILKLMTDDGAEETVGADEVKQDTGSSSTSVGTMNPADPLTIPKTNLKKKTAVSV